MRLPAVVAALLLALTLGAGSAFAAQTVTYDQVVDGLAKDSIVLVDIREPDEFVAGHVPGAVNLPLSKLTPAALPKPGDKTVVIMCRSGNRSGRLAQMLPGVGRADIADYSGSMIDWTRRGGSIVKGQ
ncbi:MAG: rhodanese-like domain-containing protein [Siculibacillus sp.]|nr:rhodanese-like domain-containing protein [Siculibacillus sp.]